MSIRELRGTSAPNWPPGRAGGCGPRPGVTRCGPKCSGVLGSQGRSWWGPTVRGGSLRWTCHRAAGRRGRRDAGRGGRRHRAGQPLTEAVRLGIAAGAAMLLTLAPRRAPGEDTERLLRQTEKPSPYRKADVTEIPGTFTPPSIVVGVDGSRAGERAAVGRRRGSRPGPAAAAGGGRQPGGDDPAGPSRHPVRHRAVTATGRPVSVQTDVLAESRCRRCSLRRAAAMLWGAVGLKHLAGTPARVTTGSARRSAESSPPRTARRRRPRRAPPRLDRRRTRRHRRQRRGAAGRCGGGGCAERRCGCWVAGVRRP